MGSTNLCSGTGGVKCLLGLFVLGAACLALLITTIFLATKCSTPEDQPSTECRPPEARPVAECAPPSTPVPHPWHNYDFSVTLGQDPWMERLSNPCEGSVHAIVHHEFQIRGREEELYYIALRGYAKLVKIRKDTQNHTFYTWDECYHEPFYLVPLKDLKAASGSPADFARALYDQYHLLAAYFRLMEVDWTKGRSCDDEHMNNYMKDTWGGLALEFWVHQMCFLLQKSNSERVYPSPALIEDHKRAMNSTVWHYDMCSARISRDCAVLNHAREVFRIFFKYLGKATNLCFRFQTTLKYQFFGNMLRMLSLYINFDQRSEYRKF